MNEIKINEKVVTKEEFEEKKKEIEEMPNAKLVEKTKDNFKIRLHD